MTGTQQDSTPETSLETPAPEVAAPTGGAGLTVPEMREWLRNWIAKATGVSHMTFFRHFPTKEAVVVSDLFDPLIAEAVARAARMPDAVPGGHPGGE